ncbi:MAG: MerR family transcriptional regulator [Planctomycetes bacterium]|nr:MerR family transcriptional regulator [Planctomycetota bacterium]
MAINGRMTITEVAEIVGVCPKTIVRWELTGKVSRAKRDWRGWRIYEKDAVKELIKFHESINDPQERTNTPQSETLPAQGG